MNNITGHNVNVNNNPPVFPYMNMASNSLHQPMGAPLFYQEMSNASENKENMNSPVMATGIPSGLPPNPFLFMKNYLPPPTLPFCLPLMSLYNPSTTQGSSAETTEEHPSNVPFDPIQIQRLLAANALLNLKNSHLPPKTYEPEDSSEGDCGLQESLIKSESDTLTNTTEHSSPNEVSSEPLHATDNLANATLPLPAIQQLSNAMNAITPKSRKSGQSTLLKSEVPGFNSARRRATKRVTPACEKDTKYYERRIRNNMSAKRSRDLRKSIEGSNSVKVTNYESENAMLRAQREKYVEEKEYLIKVLAELKNPSAPPQEPLPLVNPVCLNEPGEGNALPLRAE